MSEFRLLTSLNECLSSSILSEKSVKILVSRTRQHMQFNQRNATTTVLINGNTGYVKFISADCY